MPRRATIVDAREARPWRRLPRTHGALEVEQIVEGLPRVVGSGCRRLALDRGSWGVDRARISGVLRRDPCGNGLHALESTSRIERRALRTGMELGGAPCAPGGQAHLLEHRGPALRAPHHGPVARHVERARTVLGGKASGACGRARLGRWFSGCRRRGAITALVAVAPVSILSIAHAVTTRDSIRRDASLCAGEQNAKHDQNTCLGGESESSRWNGENRPIFR